ncbi:PRC-barrel domain-containing protein [Geodermatophilus chilensis]|uniref:PRC-barrel domain-containing protein n=1 Tax=Geodermatophilus chilensis TaxID=2035835 RepID=UPI000C2567BC|nr:PRC-barrel domain-containing protein [Geodermatophilus chilensis]
MGLPARDEASEWVGWTVVDRDGTELGAVTAVLADESTGRPEWVYVEVEGASAVVPALDADGAEGRVTVAVTRAQVTAAPSVGGARELSTAQEADLYRHYGIAASSQTSETLLPAAAETGAAAGTGAPADTTPAADTIPAADTASAPDTAGSTGRGTVAAAVALAAVAGVGVVRARARARRPVVRQSWSQRLWARRPWAPRPPSRADLAAAQVRAVSAATAEGARHLGRTAAPLAVAAAESARHWAVRAGEEVRHLGRTAAPLVLAAAESARHRAVLGAEELRHLGAVASQAAVAAVARARS